MRALQFIIILAAFVLTNAFTASSQMRNNREPKPEWKFKDRIFVGGGIQAQFGTVMAVGASPIVGYRITENFSAGVGGTYLYYRIKFQNNTTYSTSIWGGNVFARYVIWKDQVFVHSEYGFVNWEIPYYDLNLGTYTVGRRNVPYLNLGGGYRQRIANKAYFELFALYDVLHGPYSFNPSPLTIRGGVNVGL